jgi:hypothetical protein
MNRKEARFQEKQKRYKGPKMLQRAGVRRISRASTNPRKNRNQAKTWGKTWARYDYSV